MFHMNVTSRTDLALSSLCDDELGHIFNYVGDRKTIASLLEVSHHIRKAAVQIQKVRIRCFYLLSVISKADADVRSFYKSIREKNLVLVQSSPIDWVEHSSLGYYANKSLLEDDFINIESVPDDESEIVVFTASHALKSVIKTKQDRTDSYVVDMRLTPAFLKSYVKLIETLPSSLLCHVFTHLKEDFIDAMSQQPHEALDSITMISYPEDMAIQQDEEKDMSIFRLDSLIDQAKKREAGVLSVWPTKAEVAICDTSSGLLQYIETPSGEQVVAHVIIDSSSINNWSEMGVPKRLRDELSTIDAYLPVALLIGKKQGDALCIKMREHTCRFRISQQSALRDRYGNFEDLLLRAVSSHDSELIDTQGSHIVSHLGLEEKEKLKEIAFNQLSEEISRKKELSELVTSRSFIVPDDKPHNEGEDSSDGVFLEYYIDQACTIS